MDLLICQSCGQIIRSRSKTCGGCGIVMSKHAPTLLSSGLGGGTALAVTVKSDPLVLERTVNQIIYHRNGNGHNLSDGNGSEEQEPFLYSESELKNIVFPAGSDAAPSQDFEDEPEPGQDSEPDYSGTATQAENTEPAYADSPPPQTEEAEERWEQTSTGTRLPGVAAIGTPMAAGAAHALASMGGAMAPAPDGPVFQAREPSVEPAQEASRAIEPPQTLSGPQAAAPEQAAEDDFFSRAPAKAESSSEFDASPAAAPTPMTTGFDSPPAAAPIAEPEPQIQTIAAPIQAPVPGSSPAQGPPSTGGFSSPASTSAQSSSRPGLMDFFSATSSNSPTQAVETGVATGPAPDLSASFAAASQASIIQNAIQAAAGISAQSNTSVELASKEKQPEKDDKQNKRDIKKSGKKNLRPTPKEENEEEEPTKLSSKKGKLDTVKGKKAAGADSPTKSNKSGQKKAADKSKNKAADASFEVLGFSLPAKVLKVAGVLILFVGLPLIVLIANITSIIGSVFSGAGTGAGTGSAMTASAPALMAGEWDLAFSNPNGSVGQGVMTLNQSGNNFQGSGMDKAQFQVAGTVNGNKVTFNKQYVQGGQPVGKPIVYGGQIDYANENPPPGEYFVHMSGIWQLTKREGYSWRAQIVSMTGKWEARLTKRGMGTGMVAAQPGGQMSMGQGGGVTDVKDPKKAHDFFMKVALGIIGIGVALAMVSLKFFGPSGLLNIWAKKEYIPSQFKSQHFKMVAEMGKPLRPGGVPLGTRNDWGPHQFWRPRKLNMPPELREQNPHMLILGAGAKGKSRLMASMIANDIESAERAVVVVDSDGALVDLLMNWIAAHPKGKQIAKRVIVIDPTHDGEPICYNPLEFPEDGDLQNAASSIVFGFKAIYTEPPGSQSQWNQQTANILRNSAVLLMANGRTLTDLPVLLSDNDFRDILLEKVERIKSEKSEYTTLIDAWSNYKRLARTDQWINWIEPILNRVQPMLGDPRIRPILTQAKSDLNLQNIIREKKILFVKIPQGQLDQNGNLLGSLMVTGVKQAALSLSVRGKDKKRPCAMYLDEFDTFIEKETFDAITSETRKFQLGFCGASKTLQTLPEDYRNQLVINVGMMAVFALAKKDGDMLGPQMFRVDGRKVKHQTIQNVFNKVNTSPQFELISDEEKLNIDRVVGQEERTYFCYRVGTVAGVFNMKTPEFKDVLEKDINMDIMEQMFNNRLSRDDDDSDDAEEEDDDEQE